MQACVERSEVVNVVETLAKCDHVLCCRPFPLLHQPRGSRRVRQQGPRASSHARDEAVVCFGRTCRGNFVRHFVCCLELRRHAEREPFGASPEPEALERRVEALARLLPRLECLDVCSGAQVCSPVPSRRAECHWVHLAREELHRRRAQCTGGVAGAEAANSAPRSAATLGRSPHLLARRLPPARELGENRGAQSGLVERAQIVQNVGGLRAREDLHEPALQAIAQCQPCDAHVELLCELLRLAVTQRRLEWRVAHQANASTAAVLHELLEAR